MYRPLSPKPSGLLLQQPQSQPQRYSDRHFQQTVSSEKSHTLRHFAAQKDSDPKKSLQPGDATQTGKRDEDRGIKSYLKKTHPTDPARDSKPDVNKQVEELKKTEKESL